MTNTDTSYGIIPLRRREGGWEALLVHHQAGHWAFPKGHADGDETPWEAAERELFEETGQRVVKQMKEHTLQEEYTFERDGVTIHKTVLYFLAEVRGSLTLQEEEIQDAKWLKINQLVNFVTFPEAQRLCRILSEFFDS